MDAEIDDAATARERAVVEPRFVGSIGVVERQIDGEDLAQLAAADRAGDRLDSGGAAVRQVDRQQPAGAPRGLDDAARLAFVAAERLLAEHRDPAIEGGDRLLRVQRARRGDHQAIEPVIEQGFQRRQHGGTWREVGRLRGAFRIGVGHGHGLDRAAGDDRLHSMASDPAGAEKSDARPAHAKVTSALTKPPGLSRVASSALPSCSRE